MFIEGSSDDEGEALVGFLCVYEAAGYRGMSTNSFRAVVVSEWLKFDAYFQISSNGWLRLLDACIDNGSIESWFL